MVFGEWNWDDALAVREQEAWDSANAMWQSIMSDKDAEFASTLADKDAEIAALKEQLSRASSKPQG